MTLREWVINYPLPTGVLTESQWQEAFNKFKIALFVFKTNNVNKTQ